MSTAFLRCLSLATSASLLRREDGDDPREDGEEELLRNEFVGEGHGERRRRLKAILTPNGLKGSKNGCLQL